MDKKIEKPQFVWYYGLPFAKIWNKGARDYHKDREIYENQFLLNSEKERKKQEKMINGISALLIVIITSLWSTLPSLIEVPNWLQWTKLGMEDVSWKTNWGGAIWMFIVPSTAGTFIHKAPYILPHKKARAVANITIKIIPVILLILTYYLIYTEKKIWKFKKIEKQNLINSLSIPDEKKESYV